MKEAIKNTKWTCTDPDQKQYGRQISEKVFEFKQGDEQMVIDLDRYSKEEQSKHIADFGYSFENPAPKYSANIHEVYGKQANWIIAECIFENLI